jgi:hypothetical protein
MGKFTGLDGITYSGDDAKIVLLDDVFQDAELTSIMTIVDGVVAKQRLAYVSNLTKIVKADSGCGNDEGITKTFADREKLWDPEDMEAWLTICEKDFRDTIAQYQSRTGNEVITNPMAEAIALELMRDAIMKDVARHAWFNHKDAAAYTAGGILLNAGIVADYNVFNGFFEQIMDGVADGLIPNTVITANAGATTDAQLELTAGTAKALFRTMKRKADGRLKKGKNLQLLCTTELFENYTDGLDDLVLESSKFELINGHETVKFGGITIVHMDDWSRTIAEDFRKDASSLFRPHRAVLCSKDELMNGFCKSSSPKAIEIWVDKSKKLQHFRCLYKNHTLIGREYMFSVAGLEAIS